MSSPFPQNFEMFQKRYGVVLKLDQDDLNNLQSKDVTLVSNQYTLLDFSSFS